MSNPTITVTANGAGGMDASPSALSTSGGVDITNNYGSTIYYIFNTSASWPSGGSGTSLGNGNTASETVPSSGYMLFSTSASGPGLTNTRISKNGGGGLAPPKGSSSNPSNPPKPK